MLTRIQSYLHRSHQHHTSRFYSYIRPFTVLATATTTIATATYTTNTNQVLAIQSPPPSKHSRKFGTSHKQMSISSLPLDKLTYVRGDPVTFEQLKGKKIIVLELWASWCGPCVKSIPHLTELAHSYASRDVIFIGVTDEDEKVAKQFVQKMGDKMDYTVAADPDGHLESLRQEHGVNGIPHAFIIDHEGKIVYSGHPMQQQFENKLDTSANALKQSQRVRINLKGKTAEELKAMSVKDLKAAMIDNNIDPRGCLEKQELVDKVLENLK